MKRAVLAFLLLSPLVGGGCTHYQLIQDGELNERALRKMERETGYARGLAFTHPVDGAVLDEEEVEAYFEARFGGPSPYLDRQTKIGHKLGILPGHVNLADLYKKSYAKNAAALYERQGDGRMLIFPDIFPLLLRIPLEAFNWATATDWLNELVVSHELVHALQDQHFDLDEVLPGRLYAEDEDRALAHKSVVESEANLVSYAYLFHMDMESWAQRNVLTEYLLATSWMTVGLALLGNRRSPSFYTKLLTWQYFHGMRFLQRVSNRDGGFVAVTRAYRGGLPQSTEQLLWPEKYDGEDYDPPVHLAPLDPTVLDGWTPLDDNTFGELSLRTLLELHLSGTDAREAAKGWGGDRWSVLEKDERVLLAWRFLWDSPEEAEQFVRAYERVLAGKYPDRMARRADRTRRDPWRLWRVTPSAERGAGVPTQVPELVALRREGRRVVVLEGLAPADWRAVAEEVWAATRPAELQPEAPRLADLPLPEPHRRPDRGLERTFLAPHHVLEARFGFAYDPNDRTRLPRETQFRWGFRPGLELSLPFVLTAGGQRGPLLGTITGGMSLLSGRGPWGVGATGAFLVGQTLAVAGQVRAEGDLLPRDSVEPGALFLTVAGAVHLRLFERVALSLGAGWERAGAIADADTPPVDRFVLGAATTRGFLAQPTLELRLVDGLHAYETTRLTLGPDGTLLQQRHTFGLLAYF